MTDDDALQYLSGSDAEKAQHAFDWLVRNHRARLIRSLCRNGLSLNDADDALQDALRKNWTNRRHFQNKGIASWLKYVHVGAIRCYLDGLPPVSPLPLDPDLIPSEDGPILEGLLVGLRTRRLYVCADALWLQTDPSIDTAAWERQLLVANLYYIDGADLQDILEILMVSDTSKKPTISQIQRWLQSPSLLLRLAYQNLYLSNKDLNAFIQQNNVDLDQTERKVVDRHFQCGLSPAKILSDLREGDLTKEAVIALLNEICLRLPFASRMQELLRQLEDRSYEDVYRLFAQPGLWQRLAFQYHYRDELPPDCIIERTEPAARLVEFRMSTDQVNTWTYGGRLRNSLLKYWKEHFQGDFDEGY